MFKLLKKNYDTYIDASLGQREGHTLRLIIFCFISLIVSVFAPQALSGVYSMMATGVTVLTGFTFTALFSDHALASSGLPQPRNENDVQDLRRLETLSKNFGARSSYFIALSIIEVILLAATSVEFSVPASMNSWLMEEKWLQVLFASNWFILFSNIADIMGILFHSIIIFVYLECLYTFYRMAETILAILETRRIYLSTKQGDDL